VAGATVVQTSMPLGSAAGVANAAASVSPKAVAEAMTGDNRGFLPIPPARVMDTRPVYGGAGALKSSETRTVNVTSVLGVTPSEVAAVALNVTVTQPQAPGFLTVWPGGARPVVSTINFVAGLTVPNGVLLGVDATGAVSLFAGAPGSLDVVVDVTGWVPAGAGFTPIAPVRVLETRPGSPGYSGGGRFGRNETRLVDVVSRAGLPAGKVGAVALNLTVSGPTGNGFLKAYPSGAPLPPTSSLNFAAGQVVANNQVLGVGADGAITVNAYLDAPTDSADVVVDVTGWFSPDRTFHPISPQRLIDTREPFGTEPATPVAGGETNVAKIDALADLPRGLVGAVALNVTVSRPSAVGFLTIWPLADTTIAAASHGQPATSFVNFAAGQTVANTVVVGLGTGVSDLDGDGQSDVSGAIGLLVNQGTADVIIDVTGWFPQDTFGLVADATEARRYSSGTDRIAVIGCTPGAEAFTPAEVAGVTSRLAQVSAYYQGESSGHYAPQYTWVGAVAPQAGSGDADCEVPAQGSGLASGFDGELVVRRHNSAAMSGVKAYGKAGPGFTCADPVCARGTYPTNGRDGIVTLNTLLGVGDSANGTPPPFWMVATHEFGHTLDWPHSYTGTGAGCWGSQYDNPVDLMSRPATGSPDTCARLGGAFPTDPQRTLALNRYAAGWLAPSLVAVHRQSGATYDLGVEGSGATELLVVPSPDGAAFTTLEARVAGGTGPDATLLASGVAVHRVDQRADTYNHVFGPGAVVDLGGVTLTVVSASATTFTVRLDGTTAAFGHIAACGVYAPCMGTAIVDVAAAPTVVCLVGAGSGAGRDVPSVKSVTTDVRPL
jgi:hypothetical protein